MLQSENGAENILTGFHFLTEDIVSRCVCGLTVVSVFWCFVLNFTVLSLQSKYLSLFPQQI